MARLFKKTVFGRFNRTTFKPSFLFYFMRLSKEKRNKISEQILGLLFIKSPQAMFTAHIAQEMARDEEFMKKLLTDLKHKKLVEEIKKNPEGVIYLKRSRWKLSDKAYLAYKQHQ